VPAKLWRAKESGVWGVQPNEGYKIELTEEMLFENARQRNVRDLQGLADASGGELRQLEELKERAQSENSSDEDQEPPAIIKMPHVDQPLKKAKEVIEASIAKKAAA